MKALVLIVLLISANYYSCFAQDNKTFNAPHASGQEVACTSITLLPGFSFNSASGGSLDLRIDNSACSPAISTIDVPDAKASNAGTALDYNYIITITPTSETPSVNFDKGSLTVDRTLDKNVQTQISIQYYDGLGRPLETVQRGITPSNKDLVSYQGYDDFGRLDTAWLPSIGAGNGAFTTPNAIATADKALYNDAAPFAKPIYEDSPLNRIAEQYGAGADWYAQKKSVKTAYLTNTSSGNLVCALYSVGGTKALPSLKKAGNYADYELYVTQTTDEDGNIAFQFKNKLGQVVLSRQINNGINNDTYFVYDDFGNLTYVLPPLAADALNQDNATGWSDASDALVKYAYLYQYDSRNRCIKKRIPGADWQYLVYDQTDQLIFSQDGEQRLKNEWLFTIPDAFHRTVLSGVCKNTDISFTKYDNLSVRASLTGVASPYKGYTITGVTLSSPSLYLVNYYDNYSFNNQYGFPNWSCEDLPDYGKQYTGSGGFESKGLLTGTATALLDSSNTFVYTANYYDNKQRVIQSKATNHLKGTEKVYVAYNFMGKPILKKHVSEVPSQTTITEVYTYTYDQALRLITTNYQINSYPVICLEQNTYDELGRLLTSTKANQSKLTTSYAYNVRSMLSASSNPLFAEKLYYNETYSGASKAYNGNISAIAWSNASNSSYTLQYDNLSQLKAFSLSDKTNPTNSCNVTYTFDKQGNILKANNYTSVYAGNQLVQLDNYALGTFLYNKNGALSKDLSKGIINISYNYLNLPLWVNQFGSTGIGNVHYIYSADGNKLQTKLASSLNLTTDYVGNAIYQNGSLKTVLFDGGYLEGGQFFFYLQDHLGNNRVVADAAGNAIQRNDYYPFGGLFASNTASSIQPYKYNGKEYCTELGLNQFDYSARWMDPRIGRFTTVDPLAEKYYGVSPYAYCHNNPVVFIDPDGQKIVGITKDDATKVQQDFNTIFADKKFDQFRGLITLDKKGQTFNSISAESATRAFEGVTLSTDEQALVDQVTGAINSKSVHKVEFVDISEEVSTEGTSAFKTHLNNTQAGVGDAMIPGTNMPGSTMNAVSGGGINIPTKNGSYSVIMEGNGVKHDGGRAVTTGHEIIGHGVASANKVFGVDNNTRAIRVDNLIRRVMGITTFRDEHGGAKIVNPNALP